MCVRFSGACCCNRLSARVCGHVKRAPNHYFASIYACFSVLIMLLTLPAHAFEVQGLETDKSPEGFMWYGAIPEGENNKPEETSQTNTKETVTNPSPNLSTPEGRNQALKERLETAIQKVLDQPTVDNAISAQRLQKVVFERSEEVSKVWLLATLLDAGLLKPQDNPNPLNRKILQEEKKGEVIRKLSILAKDWGLLVEISDHCGYCKSYLPILDELQQKTFMQILAVGSTASSYGPYPVAEDTATSKAYLRAYNPEGYTPTTYLIHKDGKEIYPVARGLTDAEAVMDNILSVLAYRSQPKDKRARP